MYSLLFKFFFIFRSVCIFVLMIIMVLVSASNFLAFFWLDFAFEDLVYHFLLPYFNSHLLLIQQSQSLFYFSSLPLSRCIIYFVTTYNNCTSDFHPPPHQVFIISTFTYWNIHLSFRIFSKILWLNFSQLSLG